MTFREMEYVEAARALGASNLRIIVSEILPNGFGPIIVESTLGIGYAIMEESDPIIFRFWYHAANTQLGKFIG